MPHAGFSFGDLDAWRAAHPGIEAVLTAADVPGLNAFGVIPGFVDQPVFAETTPASGARPWPPSSVTPPAMAQLRSRCLSRSHGTCAQAVMDCDTALAPGAPQLHPDRAGNIMCGGHVSCGDPDAALTRADVTVEGRFTTGFVEHAYIEPEAGFAEMDGDRVEVHACTQAPVMDQDALHADPGPARASGSASCPPPWAAASARNSMSRSSPFWRSPR